MADGADVDTKSERGRTPLPSADRWDHKEIVELLIGKGADLNAKDEDGDTPLDGVIDQSTNNLTNRKRRSPPQTRWQDE